MASIRVRENKAKTVVTYAVLWRDDRDKQKCKTWPTLESAETWKRLIEATRGDDVQARKTLAAVNRRKPLLHLAITEHIDGLSSASPRTRKDYKTQAAKWITPHLGHVPVDELSPAQVRNWVQTLVKADLSDKSIANVHGLLSAALTTAIQSGLRPDNPCRGVRLPRRTDQEAAESFLTEDEWEVLEGEIGNRVGGHYVLLFRTLISTGIRWGEAAALRVGDFQFGADSTMSVMRAVKRDEEGHDYIGPTKTKRSRRIISVPATLAQELEAAAHGRPRDEPMFTGTTGNLLHHPGIYTNVWLPAIRAAQDSTKYGARALTKTPRIHDLRHSHASWLLASGMDLKTVQDRMGHESIKTTGDRYSHALPAQQRAAADVLDRMIRR